MNLRKSCLSLMVIPALLFGIAALPAQEAPKTQTIQTPFGAIIRPNEATALSPDSTGGYYRLDFVLRETEDTKILNTRNYSLWLKAGLRERGTVRISDEVAISVNQTSEILPSTPGRSNKNTQKSVSVNLECYLKEIDSSLELTWSGNISGVIPSENVKQFPPLYRDIQLVSTAPLTPGKTMTISSVDDPGSNRRFQIDVTATKLK